MDNLKNLKVSVTVFGELEDGTRISRTPKEIGVSLEEALTFLVQFKTPPTI